MWNTARGEDGDDEWTWRASQQAGKLKTMMNGGMQQAAMQSQAPGYIHAPRLRDGFGVTLIPGICTIIIPTRGTNHLDPRWR